MGNKTLQQDDDEGGNWLTRGEDAERAGRLDHRTCLQAVAARPIVPAAWQRPDAGRGDHHRGRLASALIEAGSQVGHRCAGVAARLQVAVDAAVASSPGLRDSVSAGPGGKQAG